MKDDFLPKPLFSFSFKSKSLPYLNSPFYEKYWNWLADVLSKLDVTATREFDTIGILEALLLNTVYNLGTKKYDLEASNIFKDFQFFFRIMHPSLENFFSVNFLHDPVGHPYTVKPFIRPLDPRFQNINENKEDENENQLYFALEGLMDFIVALVTEKDPNQQGPQTHRGPNQQGPQTHRGMKIDIKGENVVQAVGIQDANLLALLYKLQTEFHIIPNINYLSSKYHKIYYLLQASQRRHLSNELNDYLNFLSSI